MPPIPIRAVATSAVATPVTLVVTCWILSAGVPPDAEAQLQRELRVATREAPPFVIAGRDGLWTGIGIDLWQDIAELERLRYRFVEMGLDEMITAVAEGSVDLTVSPLTVTADRERVLDFSHPFYTSGLSIAVPAGRGNVVVNILRALTSTTFLKVTATLLVILVVAGILMWWFERKRNPEQFGGKPWQGVGAGFWWAAVTMTTVGYGDKAPRSVGGRVVGLIWMFASLVTISAFTAGIATALTLRGLESDIRGPNDLTRRLTGTVESSASETYLLDQGLATEPFPGVPQALAGLTAGEVDAVVYDAPILRYWVHQRHRGAIIVLPGTFVRQDYAFALPTASPLRERINQALLHVVQDRAWQETLNRYLGGS